MYNLKVLRSLALTSRMSIFSHCKMQKNSKISKNFRNQIYYWIYENKLNNYKLSLEKKEDCY